VSLLANYEVTDAAVATNRVQSYLQGIYSAIQVALREEVAGLTIEQLLTARSELGNKVHERAVPSVADFGVALRSVELRDVMLPGDLKRAFAQEVVARKEGAAILEKARGETAALRNLANAARLIEDNPALYQLRVLQQIGASTGNTIVLGQSDLVSIRQPRGAKKDKTVEAGGEAASRE